MRNRPILCFLVDDLSVEGIGGVACTRHLVATLASECDLQLIPVSGFYPWKRLRSQWIRAAVMNVWLAFLRFPKGAFVVLDAAYARETCLALRVWKIRSRVRMFGIVHHFTFNVKPQGAGRLLFHQCEKWFTAGMDEIFVNSRSTHDQVAAFLSVPVPIHRFWVPKPGGTATSAKPRGRAPGSPIRFLFVGSVDSRKGADQAAEAVIAYRGERPIEFRLVGSVADWGGFSKRFADLLRTDVERRITALGHLDANSLAKEFSQADAFLFPSHWEGYGMAVEEALSNGLPVITYNVGAVPELVDSENGWLVPDNDVAALAKAVAECAEDDTLRLRKSSCALARAAELQAAREPMEAPFLRVFQTSA